MPRVDKRPTNRKRQFDEINAILMNLKQKLLAAGLGYVTHDLGALRPHHCGVLGRPPNGSSCLHCGLVDHSKVTPSANEMDLDELRVAIDSARLQQELVKERLILEYLQSQTPDGYGKEAVDLREFPATLRGSDSNTACCGSSHTTSRSTTEGVQS